MDVKVRIFRCTQCGKWSHAARAPKCHKRYVRDLDELDRLGIELAYNDLDDHETFFEDGAFIDCGPFETWLAEKVAA